MNFATCHINYVSVPVLQILVPLIQDEFITLEIVKKYAVLICADPITGICSILRINKKSTLSAHRQLTFLFCFPGKELVSQVGAEVDRLEAEIRKLVPGVVHVDLEVDRGKIERRFKENSVDSVNPSKFSVSADESEKELL